MKKLYAVVFAVGLAMAVGSQANAISIDLVQIGGTYAGEGSVPVPSDTLVLDIRVLLGAGESLTGAFVTLDLEGAQGWMGLLPGCGGCSFTGGTEAAFNNIGGVLLTPIGTPGADIGPGAVGGTIKGWEATTLTTAGAPGPASFSIGSASFHLNGSGTIRVAPEFIFGTSTGTVIGGANFVNITGSSSLDTFFIPEPTTAVLLGMGLAGLAMATRREN